MGQTGHAKFIRQLFHVKGSDGLTDKESASQPAKCLKGNKIYRVKFHFRGKLHDFKEIFLGDSEVFFI